MTAKGERTVASPLEQFEIKRFVEIGEVGGFDLSFTNAALFMVLATVVCSAFMILSVRSRALVPGRWQSMAELSYEFVANMVRENVGSEGRKFFPFVFSLFMFILLGNLLGMIPYSFTFTSHIIVTFALAMIVFLLVTLVGLAIHGLHFFTYFFPAGAPKVMAPLLIPIEILSYLSRPVSLSIRLFANMMAGHTMLKVFAGFTIGLGVLGGWAPLAINVALTGFEVLVAVLQAYVFTILTCLYLHDAIHLH
jgi:F-type H+-transporting ATPase subunit a